MNNIDIAKGLIFKELNVSKDTFNDRLISQKKIYLIQQLGLDLGYSYNWYIKGPYSPNLTAYLYDNLDMLREYDYSQYFLMPEAKAKIDIVNNLSEKNSTDLNEKSWFELLASIIYLNQRLYNNEDLFTKLSSLKPQFTQTQFETAKQLLISENFLQA